MTLGITSTGGAAGTRRKRRKSWLVLSLFVVALLMGRNFRLMVGQLSTYNDNGSDAPGFTEEWVVATSSSAANTTSVSAQHHNGRANSQHYDVNAMAPTTHSLRGNASVTKPTHNFAKITMTVHDGNTTATSSSMHPRLKGTAVIQLMGEFGNHLSILTCYHALKTIASTEFNLDLTLHVRKQPSSKADSAAKNFECLEHFRELDFDECNWNLNWTKGDDDVNIMATPPSNMKRGEVCQNKANDQMEALQDLMMSTKNMTIARLSQCLGLGADLFSGNTDEIRNLLRCYVSMLEDDSILDLYRRRNVGWSASELYPFLFSTERLNPSDGIINEFYDRGLPEYFAFNYNITDNERRSAGVCCSLMPEEDEQVYHYRSFVTDMPLRNMEWGGAEFRPYQAAEMLAASLPPGTKIAFVSGRAYQNRVLDYLNAFRNQSFVVREITGQSSIQDFCFLSHAKAGLWGVEKSSYAVWASLIGGRNMKNATLYGVNYPSRGVSILSKVVSNPELARVVHYPVFDVSDEDVW